MLVVRQLFSEWLWNVWRASTCSIGDSNEKCPSPGGAVLPLPTMADTSQHSSQSCGALSKLFQSHSNAGRRPPPAVLRIHPIHKIPTEPCRCRAATALELTKNYYDFATTGCYCDKNAIQPFSSLRRSAIIIECLYNILPSSVGAVLVHPFKHIFFIITYSKVCRIL